MNKGGNISFVRNPIWELRQYFIDEGYKPANEVAPNVTENDYYISTQGTFQLSNKQEYDNIDSTEFVSRSFSRYKIKDGILYRQSNHWGIVSTCRWHFPYLITKSCGYFLKKEDRYIWLSSHRPTVFGKIRISDLKRINNSLARIENI